MPLLLVKVFITILIVSALAIIAERVSPRAAGILSGYPLGSAIALFFIGLEQSAEFAGQSAAYNVAGLAAMLTFLYLYYRVSLRADRLATPLAVLLATLAGLGGFLAVAALLAALRLTEVGSALLGASAILAAGALFRRIPETVIASRVRLGPGVILIRAGLAALVILLITGAAHVVPPAWAGLFSSFPATVFPLLLILHTTYGARYAHSVIRNLPTGLWALAAYALTISQAYPRIGIYWGTLLGFAVATSYLLGLAAARGYRLKLARQGQAFARKKI